MPPDSIEVVEKMRLYRLLSFVGGPRVRAVLVALTAVVLMARRRYWSIAVLLLATTGMGAVNTAVKIVTRRPRPLGLPGLKQAGGYSFPSGHTSGSVVFFGVLAYLIEKGWRRRIRTPLVLSAALVLAGLIGQSRVALRAHHRVDVVVGYATGAAWLALVLRAFARPLAREWR